MKVFIKTIGCKLNQCESETLMARLSGLGFSSSPEEDADICVINTCTVTGKADYKSRNAVGQAARNNPNAKIFITGCYSAMEPGIFGKITDCCVEPDKKRLLEKIARLTPASTPENCAATLRSRPFVKIQDGCDAKCSYCRTRIARGKSVSLPVNNIIREINIIFDRGFNEVVLVGTNIGAYSHSGSDLAGLLEKITAGPGTSRIRLSSIEPAYCTEKLISTAAGNPRICPHFHIPLQSGSDSILKKMERNYTAKKFTALVDKIKTRIRDVNVGTDIIAGFPGETDADFKATLTVAKQCEFGYAHIFKYSKRLGTAALRLPGQIDERIKAERSSILREIAEENKIKFRGNFLGSTLSCLIEGRQKALSGNYIDIDLASCAEPKGALAQVKIEKQRKMKVFGKCI